METTKATPYLRKLELLRNNGMNLTKALKVLSRKVEKKEDHVDLSYIVEHWRVYDDDPMPC